MFEFLQGPDEAVIRVKKVLLGTGMKKTTLYRKIREGSFPSPVHLTEHCVGWRLGDIRDWLKSRAH